MVCEIINRERERETTYENVHVNVFYNKAEQQRANRT